MPVGRIDCRSVEDEVGARAARDGGQVPVHEDEPHAQVIGRGQEESRSQGIVHLEGRSWGRMLICDGHM